jgi:hypothetical protein
MNHWGYVASNDLWEEVVVACFNTFTAKTTCDVTDSFQCFVFSVTDVTDHRICCEEKETRPSDFDIHSIQAFDFERKFQVSVRLTMTACQQEMNWHLN